MAQCKMWLTLSSPLNGLHHLTLKVNKNKRENKRLFHPVPSHFYTYYYPKLSICFAFYCYVDGKKVFFGSSPCQSATASVTICVSKKNSMENVHGRDEKRFRSRDKNVAVNLRQHLQLMQFVMFGLYYGNKYESNRIEKG